MNDSQKSVYDAMSEAIDSLKNTIDPLELCIPEEVQLNLPLLPQWIIKNDELAQKIHNGFLTLDPHRNRILQMKAVLIEYSMSGAELDSDQMYDCLFHLMTGTFDISDMFEPRLIKVQALCNEIHASTYKFVALDWSMRFDQAQDDASDFQMLRALQEQVYCESLVDFLESCNQHVLQSEDSRKVRQAKHQEIGKALQRVYDGETTHSLEIEHLMNRSWS